VLDELGYAGERLGPGLRFRDFLVAAINRLRRTAARPRELGRILLGPGST
jgi:hypothetical protein